MRVTMKKISLVSQGLLDNPAVGFQVHDVRDRVVLVASMQREVFDEIEERNGNFDDLEIEQEVEREDAI